MALPSAGTQHGAAVVPAMVGSALGRVGGEAVGIWREARTLSRGREDAAQAAKPSSEDVYLAWYAGVATMALLRVIEWRLAAVIAVMHTVERYTHRRRLEEFLEGVEAGGV
jgi:succinate dehydrogenase/fumarate reductase flavoprotein subunit